MPFLKGHALGSPRHVYGWTGGRRLFLVKTDMPFWKRLVSDKNRQYSSIVVHIYKDLVNIGIPKSHLRLNRRPQTLFFWKTSRLFWNKWVLINICYFLRIFVNIWSIIVSIRYRVRTYLLYGTAYVRTHLLYSLAWWMQYIHGVDSQYQIFMTCSSVFSPFRFIYSRIIRLGWSSHSCMLAWRYG